MQPVVPLWPALLLALAVVLAAVGAGVVVGLVLWLARGRRPPVGSDRERPGETVG